MTETTTTTAISFTKVPSRITKGIVNPYLKRSLKDHLPRVSISPTKTQHKTLLEGGGETQPPPTNAICFDKRGKMGEDCTNQKNYDLPEQGTEIVHADHGMFYGKSSNFLFVVIPLTDEFGCPEIDETLRRARDIDVEKDEIIADAPEKKKLNVTNITDESNVMKKTVRDTQKSDDPQWIQRTKENIPRMSSICEILSDETEAMRFLANRGVIDPIGICIKCKGE